MIWGTHLCAIVLSKFLVTGLEGGGIESGERGGGAVETLWEDGCPVLETASSNGPTTEAQLRVSGEPVRLYENIAREGQTTLDRQKRKGGKKGGEGGGLWKHETTEETARSEKEGMFQILEQIFPSSSWTTTPDHIDVLEGTLAHEGPTLEQFFLLKDCTPWRGAILEQRKNVRRRKEEQRETAVHLL